MRRNCTDTLRFFAGDTLYVLNYLDLGSWDWWYRGKAGVGQEFWSGALQRSFSGRENLPAVSISAPRGDWWYNCGRSPAPRVGYELTGTAGGTKRNSLNRQRELEMPALNEELRAI